MATARRQTWGWRSLWHMAGMSNTEFWAEDDRGVRLTVDAIQNGPSSSVMVNGYEFTGERLAGLIAMLTDVQHHMEAGK